MFQNFPSRSNCSLLCLIVGTSTLLKAAAAPTWSQIRLKNGDVLSGEVIGIDADHIRLHLSYAGLVVINRSEVQEFGPLQPTAAKPGEIAVTPKDPNVSKVTGSAKPWSLQLDLSAATRAGKEQAKNYSLTERFEYRVGDWRSQFDALYDYETKEAARKTHKYELNPGLDYFYSPQLFWRVNAGYSYNYLASDYKNVDINSGPGYAVWQQGPTRLDLVLLLGRKQAYFREDETFRLLPDFESPLGYNTASLAWDFSHKWPGTLLEVYSEGNWLELLSQPLSIFDFERELNMETGLRYALTDQIRISWSWQYDRTELTLMLPKMPHRC